MVVYGYTMGYRPYAIPRTTKREMDTAQKSRSYAAILSGKKECCMERISAVKHFASSLSQ